jgi:hypothetical protein
MVEVSFKEQRIRKITSLYYSRPDVQRAIFDFSKDREVIPSYMMESFGKRPDSLQYKGDLFELVKRGATSFHCSQELWHDPLKIQTGMSESQLNELRLGWDFLIDIDSKYLDYSKVMAEILIKVLRFHGIKNLGIKFSGSKGFHIIIPWKAFPKKIQDVETASMFPAWPRIITRYLIETIKKELIEKISNLEKPNKYIKDFQASSEVMPDLILVSSRHLFRVPYSLHEKTALASVVINPSKISEFELKDADPLNMKIRNFLPDSEPNEAKELLIQALDWHKLKNPEEDEKKDFEFKPIKLENLSDKHFPPTIQKILQGVEDGRKRSLFILINLFRSLGMDKEELEKRISDWNKKNPMPLKEGYVKSQLLWAYRNKIVSPPNFDKDYYKGIGLIPTEEELKSKNPLSYIVRKHRLDGKKKTR